MGLQRTLPSRAVNELGRESAPYRPNSRRVAAILIGQMSQIGFTRESPVYYLVYYSLLTGPYSCLGLVLTWHSPLPTISGAKSKLLEGNLGTNRRTSPVYYLFKSWPMITNEYTEGIPLDKNFCLGTCLNIFIWSSTHVIGFYLLMLACK